MEAEMRVFCVVSSFWGALILSGCMAVTGTVSPPSDPASTVVTGSALAGMVHGGEAPIAGAQLYLYAANTSGTWPAGYSNASVSLLTSATGNPPDANGNYYVTSNASGTWSITGDYTCPSANTQVYLYSIGGNPGLASGPNPNAGLLAGLGSCGSLSAATFVIVNEVSTIATAYAIAGYATDALHVSSPSDSLALQGLANAFAAIPNLEFEIIPNYWGTAIVTTPAGNGAVPQAEINTLANILGACVQTAGPSSTACTTLFSNSMNGTTPPTDTATAAINIAHNPGANVSTLFGLQSSFADFLPHLAAKPNDSPSRSLIPAMG
jgi:hypothetical protein